MQGRVSLFLKGASPVYFMLKPLYETSNLVIIVT